VNDASARPFVPGKDFLHILTFLEYGLDPSQIRLHLARKRQTGLFMDKRSSLFCMRINDDDKKVFFLIYNMFP
jgi:hypothetical protein